MKKIVLSGASGFLGKALLCRMVDDEKYQVYALSSRPEKLKESTNAENVVFMHKDAFATEQGAEILNDAILINCAYPRNTTGENVADGLTYIFKLFEAAKENAVKAVINISSQSLYSPQRTEAASEETPVCLDSKYAVGKYATELMLAGLCKNTAIEYTNIRMASLIGPGFEQRIVNRLTKQAIENHKISINDNNKQFGYFDIEDAANGILAVVESEGRIDWDPVYNLGNRNLYTLVDIANTIKDVLSEPFTIDVVKEEGEEAFCSAVDSEKFYSTFGFEPCFGLKQSIEKIAAYYNTGTN